MTPTSQTGPFLDDTYKSNGSISWWHLQVKRAHFFETNLISLLQTNVIVETSNLMLQCLIQKMCQINLIKLIWPRICGLKGSLHTTTFSKYTELLQLQNIFRIFWNYFWNIFKINVFQSKNVKSAVIFQKWRT